MTGRLLKFFFLGLLIALDFARAESITIATYNVENYVATDRMTEGGYRKDYPKPEVQKAALRTVLREVNADILVLQEMGGDPYLEELRRDLKTIGLNYPHAILLRGPDQDRHVAVLSRRPFAASTQHTNIEFRYLGGMEKLKRGLLEVRFETAGGEFTVFAAHLKSRFTDRAEDPRSTLRRAGEATAIRDLVLTRFPDPSRGRFLIMGDFNDDRSSKTVQRLTKRGKTKVAELLAVADSRGETWTHAYRKQDSYTRVDHILISAGLRAAVLRHTGRIHDGISVNEASDHRPVSVTLEFANKK